jgi:hypothetical protein
MSDQSTGENLTGKTFGQYEIGELLGRGGMAVVYKAQQTSIGRTVAIKVMPSHLSGESGFLQRFEREVKVIADLQHPRVLPVYDYGQIDGRPYIVMAYMSGQTLAERIQGGALPLQDTVRLVEQIAEGLDHAHKKGVIHRDFKPSNVLLDENSNAFLADFGIAKISESTVQLTGSGIVGTPAYMAPEMADSGEVTPSVDIYALGITLFQMLTGSYPYKGETPIRIMMAHTSDPVPDVRAVRPDLPARITDVVYKAMAKTPEERYATAGALAAALKQAVQGKSEAAADMGGTFPMGLTPSSEHTPLMNQSPAGAVEIPAVPQVAAKKGGLSPLLILALVGGVIVLAVCGIGGVLLGGVAMFSPTPTPAGATLIIRNDTEIPVCYVYISSPQSDNWGSDRLGEGETIPASETKSIYGIEHGQYDIRASDCDNNMLDETYGADLSGSGFSWVVTKNLATATPAPAAGTASLKIINNSSSAICSVFVTPAGSGSSGTWGSNQLSTGQTIEPNTTFTLTDIPTGNYDFKAENCSGVLLGTAQLDQTLDGVIEWTFTDK